MAGQNNWVTATINRLERDYINWIGELLSSGAPADEIRRRQSQWLNSYGLPDAVATRFQQQLEVWGDAALASAEQMFAWIGDHTLTPEQNADIAQAMAQYSNEFAMIAGSIDTSLAGEVATALSEGASTAEITDRLRHKFARPRHQAWTVANTARAVYDRKATSAYAENAGITRFEYLGQSPQRAFCKKNYNKIRTAEEWRRLRNDFGQNAYDYCGGWNCTHWLESIVEDNNPVDTKADEQPAVPLTPTMRLLHKRSAKFNKKLYGGKTEPRHVYIDEQRFDISFTEFVREWMLARLMTGSHGIVNYSLLPEEYSFALPMQIFDQPEYIRLLNSANGYIDEFKARRPKLFNKWDRSMSRGSTMPQQARDEGWTKKNASLIADYNAMLQRLANDGVMP